MSSVVNALAHRDVFRPYPGPVIGNNDLCPISARQERLEDPANPGRREVEMGLCYTVKAPRIETGCTSCEYYKVGTVEGT